MTLEPRFSDLIKLDQNSPAYEPTARLLGRLDEEPTIAGLTPRTFMNLGRRERHKYAASEITAMLDLAQIINIAEVDLPSAYEPDLLFTEHDPEAADKTGSYDFMDSITSDRRQALKSWESFIGPMGQQIVRRQVLVAEPARSADPRTSFASGIITLPMIDNDQRNTRRLAQGVARSQVWLEKLVTLPAIDSVLEKHQATLHIARSSDYKNDRLRGDVPAQEMGKYALIRAISEGMLTNAQVLAEVIADSPLRLDVAAVAMKAYREKWADHIARGIPLGIIGPFAVAGYVPEGGLLEESGDDFKLLTNFNRALSENITRRTQLIDIVLGAKAVLGMEEIDITQLTEGQRSALTTLASMARHTIPAQTDVMQHVIGSGCPAGAHNKRGQSLISMTMQLLAKSLA